MKKDFIQLLLVYSAILCSISGCTSVKFTNSSPGQPLAEYYKYSRLTHHRTNKILDSNVLYVYAEELIRTYKSGFTESVYTYMYLVFKNNGLAFFSNDSAEPFTNDNIHLARGQYCFYVIENDEIRLEIYDRNLKKFTIMYGVIEPNRILFYQDKLRVFLGGTRKLNMQFMKSNIIHKTVLVWPK